MTNTIVHAATSIKCPKKVDAFDSVQKDTRTAVHSSHVHDADQVKPTSESLPSEAPEGFEQSDRNLRVEFAFFAPFDESVYCHATVKADGLSDFRFEMATQEVSTQFHLWQKDRGLVMEFDYHGPFGSHIMMTDLEYIELKIKWAGLRAA